LDIQSNIGPLVEQVSCRLSMGLATGKAVVGNMGSTRRRQHCVIGPVMTHAALLEQLSQRSNSHTGFSTCLLGGRTLIDEVSPFVEYQLLDIVRLPSAEIIPLTHTTSLFGEVHKPQKENTFTRAPVCTLIKAKQMASDEWMYELNESKQHSTVAMHNEAFDNLLELKIDEAIAIWEKHLENQKNDAVARKCRDIALVLKGLPEEKLKLSLISTNSAGAAGFGWLTVNFFDHCILHLVTPQADPKVSQSKNQTHSGPSVEAQCAEAQALPSAPADDE
jgi:hypothetical protein